MEKKKSSQRQVLGRRKRRPRCLWWRLQRTHVLGHAPTRERDLAAANTLITPRPKTSAGEAATKRQEEQTRRGSVAEPAASLSRPKGRPLFAQGRYYTRARVAVTAHRWQCGHTCACFQYGCVRVCAASVPGPRVSLGVLRAAGLRP